MNAHEATCPDLPPVRWRRPGSLWACPYLDCGQVWIVRRWDAVGGSGKDWVRAAIVIREAVRD